MSKKRTYYTADAYRVKTNTEESKSYQAGYLHEIALKPEQAMKLAAAINNNLAEHSNRAVRLMVRLDKTIVVR